MNIFYDRQTDIFSGSGFELVGFKSFYEPPTSYEHNLTLQNLQFVSHENPKLEVSLSEYLSDVENLKIISNK